MPNDPRLKEEENDPDIFLYPICELVQLAYPAIQEPLDFWTVLKKRHSSRSFRQLSIAEIGAVLWHSVKVSELKAQPNGYILTHRPSASAGARHPIDIIVASPTLEKDDSFYYYNPFEHTLNKLVLPETAVRSFLRYVADTFPIGQGTIFWFVAHPNRTASKYENHESLVWRDAGALIHSIQLTCAALSLNSCAVGVLGENNISDLFSAHGRVFGTGGLVIG